MPDSLEVVKISPYKNKLFMTNVNIVRGNFLKHSERQN